MFHDDHSFLRRTYDGLCTVIDGCETVMIGAPKLLSLFLRTFEDI
jgi:hypothetical protein